MRGFILRINGECISGAISEGITSIIVSSNDNQYHVYFGSLDKTGQCSCTWYTSDIQTGDCLNIEYTDINNVPDPKEVRDYNMSSDIWKANLETYLKLKKELEEEGLL